MVTGINIMKIKNKYNSFNIISHPRSGSHYMAALVAKNFFKTDDYLLFYGGHGFNYEAMQRRIASKPKCLFIYIWRSFENVAKSIFVLRNRFGLNTDSFETFLTTPYSELWSSKIKVENTIRETLLASENMNTVDSLFRKVDTIPEKFHESHVDFYQNLYFKHNRVISVYYDFLIDSKQYFNNIMNMLSIHFLGETKTNYINIEKKVGWKKC